ncbi:hypothetical protein PK35_16255 [Tamlana nanhaiensis]|uniref:PKD domain-containing protein n=2 Tax=Neotamlana nanhaiensis TaxID=1382798 RepID=A0A0D7VW92_9FLAO|nr:hypothetical protein PK35_16255 [Tamlana nanhaiensis]
MTSCYDDESIIDTKPVGAFKVNSDLIELGSPAIFTDLSFDQNGEIVAWEWNFGDGNTSDEQSPTHIYDIGEYTITLKVTDNAENQNVNEFSKTVTVLEPSTATKEPTVLWSYEVPFYSTHASVAVNEGMAYVTTDGKSSDPTRGDNVLAIKGGDLVWSDLTDEVMRMSPSVDANGTVYVGDYFAVFNAYLADGSLKWSVDLGNRIQYSSPAFAEDGTIYLGMENDDVLHAIYPDDGSIKWTFPVGHDIRATPAVDASGTIYVASSDDYFYAINPDGTEKWKVFYGDYTAGAPAISESKQAVYLSCKTSDDTGHLIAFNMADGSIIWDNASRPNAKLEQGGPSIAADGTVYVGGEDNKMVAYNPNDGSIKWEYETTGAILAAPALDNDGNLYFGDRAGYFYVVDPNGENKWAKTQLDEEINSSAAIDGNGVIYILTRNNTDRKGKVYALKTNATGIMDSEWPMLSKDAKHTGR